MHWYIVTIMGKEVTRIKARNAQDAKRTIKDTLTSLGWLKVAIAKLEVRLA